MKKVTDPKLLGELNAVLPQESRRRVTNPEVIRQLNALRDMQQPEIDEGQQQPTTGFKGIAQDIIESLRGAPSAIGSALAELPHEAYESGKQAVTHPIRALENLASGAVSGVKGAYNLPL